MAVDDKRKQYLKKRRLKRRRLRYMRMRMFRRVFSMFFLASVASTVLGADWPMLDMFTFSDSLPAFFDLGEDVYGRAEFFTPIAEISAERTREATGFRADSGTPTAVAAISTPETNTTPQATATPLATATIRVIVITASPSGTPIQTATPQPSLTALPTGTTAATSEPIATEAAATSVTAPISAPPATVVAAVFPTASPTLWPTGTATPWPVATAIPVPAATTIPTAIPATPIVPVVPVAPTPTTVPTPTIIPTTAPTAAPPPAPTTVPPVPTTVPTTVPVVPTAVPTAVPTVVPTATPNSAPVTLPVNSLLDVSVPGDGNCTAREALDNAINNVDSSGGDCPVGGTGTDTLTLPTGTVNLSSALSGLGVRRASRQATTQTIIFAGSGTVFNMNGSGRVLEISGALDVTLQGVTLQNGGGVVQGAGVLIDGATLSLQDSAVRTNTTTGAGTSGGGIAVIGGGAVTLDRAEVSGNVAIDGAGIYVDAASSLTVIQSTISGNAANGAGGGVLIDGGSAEFRYTTLADNSTDISGGGFANSGGTVTLEASIVANNSAANGADCAGAVTSAGYNLIADSSGCNTSQNSTDLLNNALTLNGLTNNGGSTQTQSFANTAAAYNAIPTGQNGCGSTITSDQIGTARPQNGACDIGAFELVFTAPDTSLAIDTTTDSNAAGFQGCDDAVANDCSLRGAMSVANSDTANAYTINLPAGVYSIAGASGEDANASGDFDILGNVTIVGADPTTTEISGAGLDRVFHLHNTTSSLTLQNVLIRDGNMNETSINNCGVGNLDCGGGVMVTQGTLVVENSVFLENVAYNGAAIATFADSSGSVTIRNSDFDGNVASLDGGAINNFQAALTIETSSLHNNLAGRHGGAILSYEGVSAEITNSTLSGNEALVGGAIWTSHPFALNHATVTDNTGGGIHSDVTPLMSGNVTLVNSIIATQFAGVDCSTAGGATITSGGYNLDSDNTCGLTGPTNDIPAGTAGLDALSQCCTTFIHTLNGTSNAYNAIPNGASGCGSTYTVDQVGNARPQFAACDIGAYESPTVFTQAFTVDTTNDGDDVNTADGLCLDATGFCSLRAAISQANALGGSTVIDFTGVAGMTIALPGANEDANATGDLDISANITINGTPITLSPVHGNGLDRVFNVLGTGTLTLNNIEIDGGDTSNSTTKIGGGIYNLGTLTVNDSRISSNLANEAAGIFNNTTATTSINRSQISSNTSSMAAGGVYNAGGTLTIVDSTISGNSSPTLGSGLLANGTTTVRSSTLTGNTGADVIDVRNGGSVLTIENSTISGNANGIYNSLGASLIINFSTIAGNGDSGIENDDTATVAIFASIVSGHAVGDCTGLGALPTSTGFNVVSDATCILSGTGDLNSTAPLLGPLANNGGSTDTHAIPTGSPGHDLVPSGTGGCGSTFVVDQRGVIRPNGPNCDSGAYERDIP